MAREAVCDISHADLVKEDVFDKAISFDRSKNTGAIDVKMDGSVLEEKTSFKMLGLNFSSKLDLISLLTLSLLLKLPPRKLES